MMNPFMEFAVMGKKIRFKASEEIHLPPDIIAGAMLVSLQDNRYVQVENYRSILQYTKEQLKIQGKNERICIQGKNLEILYYTSDECSIKGHIQNILYEMTNT